MEQTIYSPLICSLYSVDIEEGEIEKEREGSYLIGLGHAEEIGGHAVGRGTMERLGGTPRFGAARWRDRGARRGLERKRGRRRSRV